MNKIFGAMKKVYYYCRRLPKAFTTAWFVVRDGGYTKVNVSVTPQGETLKNKNIVVTGAGSGIGLALTKRFLSDGAYVIGLGRSAERVEEDHILKSSTNFTFISVDISDVSSLQVVVQGIFDRFSQIDVLVNNAGLINGKQFLNVSEADWDSVYAINSKGLFFLTQEFCKFWLQEPLSSYKKIINISSQAAFVGATYPYRMSKWDVVGFTRGLAEKLGSKGIIVNGVAPGIIPTAMQQKYQAQSGNQFCEYNPLARVALPEEVAELVQFLVCDRSNFITGQTIVLDGGFSLN